jgi:hypothetical protein
MGTFSRNLILGLGALAILWGCGSGTHSGEAARASAAAAAARKANASDSMVSAVTLNKTPTAVPVEVKFELKDRPQVAQPANIDLIIVPMSAAVDRVSGKVESDEGLDLLEGAQIAGSDHPAEGVPIRHSIKVQPQRDGIFTFSAVLVVESGGQSMTETFSMPLIAGSGMPDLPGGSGASGAESAQATAIATKSAPGPTAAVQ